MRDRLNTSLKEAMKGKDKTRLSTLRLINAAIKDRDIAGRAKGLDQVGDDEILEILAKMVKQRAESSKQYREANRPELAEQEEAETTVIAEFLPEQLSEEDMRAACREVIAETGAEGLRDMGKCMAMLKEKYAGQMDFGKASGMVKNILAS